MYYEGVISSRHCEESLRESTVDMVLDHGEHVSVFMHFYDVCKAEFYACL